MIQALLVFGAPTVLAYAKIKEVMCSREDRPTNIVRLHIAPGKVSG